MKLSYQEIMKKSYEIFHLNKNFNVGAITVKEAPKILTLTYELVGR